MSEDSSSCFVIIADGKPKIKKGKFSPDLGTGAYGRGGKSSFAIPDDVKPTINSYRKRSSPFFIVDPKTRLAQPVGHAYSNDEKLAGKIEIAANRKYLKMLTLRIFDLVQTLIVGFAGLGVGLYVLHLIGVFTGHTVSI